MRLPNQQPGERNFHIFYQMMAGASEEQRQHWGLSEGASAFHFTNQGGVYSLTHFDDEKEFKKHVQGADCLELSGERSQ